MSTLSLAFDARIAQRVTATTLEPVQQRTPPKLTVGSNFFQQRMCKHPFLSDFHSRAEFLHAGLLEGDPAVISYVPQPYRLRVGGRYYTPDCYILSTQQPPRVIELKPRGEMADALRVPLTAFFTRERMTFEVLSNESVFEREVEALNWLEIVRQLHISRLLNTTQAEVELLEKLQFEGPCAVGDIVEAGDRESSYVTEIALLRLLHKGHLTAEMKASRYGWDTEVMLCR